MRRSVQKWGQTTLKFVALNCHLQRCSVFSDVAQEVVGEQFAVVTWGVPTDHDKVHKGNGLQVCFNLACAHKCMDNTFAGEQANLASDRPKHTP